MLEKIINKTKTGFVAAATALSLYGCGSSGDCPGPRIGKRVIAEVKKAERCEYGEMMLDLCYDFNSVSTGSLYGE